MSSLIYFFKESLAGFSRNLSTTLGSIITIFLSLLIIGVFAVGGAIIQNVVSSVESQVSITAYLNDSASAQDTKDLQNYIRGINGVSQVEYISKEQAMENFKKSMTNSPEILEQLDGENPLPASINVELSDPQNVERVALDIEGNALFAKICDNPDSPGDSLKYGQKTVERLFSLTNYIRNIGIVLISLLIFIAFVFINNTIRLAILARRKEIAIMRLVGASNGFIRGPFLMEGALHALIGAGLAIGIMELLRLVALPHVSSALPWLPIALPGTTFMAIYLSLVLAGLLIGSMGSLLAMRRYLKV